MLLLFLNKTGPFFYDDFVCVVGLLGDDDDDNDNDDNSDNDDDNEIIAFLLRRSCYLGMSR